MALLYYAERFLKEKPEFPVDVIFSKVKREGSRDLFNRRHRTQISGIFSGGLKFKGGDILLMRYFIGPVMFTYEGICLAVRPSHFLSKSTTMLLRNVINGIGIEVCVAYYLFRIFNKIQFNDFKRKKNYYKKSKIFFVRNKKNKASMVY